MAVTKLKRKPTGRSAAGRSGSKKVERKDDRSSSAAPATSQVTKVESAKVQAKPLDRGDRLDQPGWIVTVRGGMPKVLCGAVFKKGPIRASSREAAIAHFMAELGTQLKKPALLDVEACDVVEAGVPMAPTLPFQKDQKDAGEKKDGKDVTPPATPMKSPSETKAFPPAASATATTGKPTHTVGPTKS